MRLTFDDAVGGVLDVQHAPPSDARMVRVEVLEAIPRGRFPQCPICLEAPADTAEHVPHGAMGGEVMTATCRRCNNMLGSRVEPHLTAWLDDTFVDVRIRVPSLPGPRKVGFTLRRTSQGPPVMLLEGPADLIGEALERDGHGEFVFTHATAARYKIAALKHAYLAACLFLGGVPMSADAVAVRNELRAARDARRPRDIRCGPRSSSLDLAKTYQTATAPPLALVRVLDPDQTDDQYGVVLAGSVLVPWPLDCHPLRSTVNLPYRSQAGR